LVSVTMVTNRAGGVCMTIVCIVIISQYRCF